MVSPYSRGLIANLAWNLTGESLPVLAAVVAIPILVHRLGADRFGVLTLSWMIAGYFGLFDFGLGRALTKAMAQELSIGRGARAAALLGTSLAMMLVLGGTAGVTLAMLAPWLTRSALKIPLALQRETLSGLLLHRDRIADPGQHFRTARGVDRRRQVRSAQPHPHSGRHHVVRRAGVDAALHPQPRVADRSADIESLGVGGDLFCGSFPRASQFEIPSAHRFGLRAPAARASAHGSPYPT